MNLRATAKAAITILVGSALITGTAYAREFTDVTKEFWGYDAIKEMSDKNIIVGYTDGTFKPSKEVKKVEVLIILSRILGVNNEENAQIAEKAETDYSAALSKYDTYAKREVSYLLSKGIIKESELDQYLGSGNDELSMKRYEIVSMLTRVMGKEEELKNKELVILDYKDAEFIPESLRAYVEYLGEEEIMGTATDDNRFMPNGVITRAQVATLMSRVVNKMSIEDGNTTPEDTSDDPIDENTNNTDTPTETDVKTPAEEETQDNIIRGPIKKVAVDLAGSKRSITIIETVNGTQKDVIIPVIENVEVTIDGKKSRVTLIKALDYAEVEVNDKGEAIRIEAEKKDKTVNGVISEVNTEKGTVTVNSNSETESFKAAIDMKVVKNGTESDITKIRKGDTVTLTLEYNLIKSINSKSIQKQVEGQISEIIISDNPKITLVDLSGKKGTYDISKNVAINVFDKKEDIYGLRLGYKAKLSLDSSEVIDISTYEQITGVIESIEESFNEISLTPDDRTLGQSIQLLTNESTKYINNKTKTEMLMRDIKVGQKVAITGRFGKASFYVKEIYVME